MKTEAQRVSRLMLLRSGRSTCYSMSLFLLGAVSRFYIQPLFFFDIGDDVGQDLKPRCRVSSRWATA